MTGSGNYRVGVRIEGNASGMSKAAQEALRAQKMLAGGSVREFQRMSDARRTLGVKSEREVQREIQVTVSAYNRLARSGTLSWHEQRMAARQMREEVTRLTNEMGRLTTRQKFAMGAKGLAAVGAGVGVATAMIAPKVQKALDYDMRVAHLANTAYAYNGKDGGKDRAADQRGRAAGMKDVNALIVDAVRFGGGTRDSAATTAESLFGAGIFKPGEIQAILREAVMAGTANNTESTAFAQMAITANQTMGIKPDQMGRLFGIGTYAGQKGGFEIKDMAKWLPQQMAAAKAVGLSGEAGVAKLAALNQAAITTAGTRDEAGNNVVNLMAKLGSQDTIKDFKKQGINLPKELAEGRMKGLDALDVVGNLLQQQLGKDKNYQQVQRKLAGAKDDSERQAALESVGNIAQGTVIGKSFQDRQALMALYGFINQRDRVKNIAEESMANPDAARRNFELVSQQAGYQTQQAKNESEIAAQASMDKLTPAIGFLAEKVTGLMREYPGYTTAIVGAAGALLGLAGSAAAAAGASWLLNRGKVPVGGGPMIPPAAGGAAGAASAAGAGSRYLGMLGTAGKTLGMAGAVSSLFFTSPEEMEILRNADRQKEGYRGKGFNDPRLLTTAQTAGERLSSTSNSNSIQQALQQDLKGEIVVKVVGAPGLQVTAETKTNSPRIPFRTDVGRSMVGSGF